MKRMLVPCWLVAAAALLCGAEADPQEKQLKNELLDSAGSQKEKLRALAGKGVLHLDGLLKSPSRIVRLAAILALAEVEADAKQAVALLEERCIGEDEEERYFALIALARRRAPEAKGLIERWVKSDVPRRREAACFAIAEYGDPALYPLLEGLAADEGSAALAARAAKALIERKTRPR